MMHLGLRAGEEDAPNAHDKDRTVVCRHGKLPAARDGKRRTPRQSSGLARVGSDQMSLTLSSTPTFAVVV